MARLTNSSGLPYKIVIESWITHASSSSQEALLWKTAAWGSRVERERSQSVPLTLPASYSRFLFQMINVHQNRYVWTVSTLSLSSFPTHVLPVLFVRKRLCILCPSEIPQPPFAWKYYCQWISVSFSPLPVPTTGTDGMVRAWKTGTDHRMIPMFHPDSRRTVVYIPKFICLFFKILVTNLGELFSHHFVCSKMRARRIDDTNNTARLWIGLKMKIAEKLEKVCAKFVEEQNWHWEPTLHLPLARLDMPRTPPLYRYI